MQKYTEKDVEHMIREVDIKCTPHRVIILAKVAKSKLPITTAKLMDDLNKKHDIDQATVYRNLIALEEAGLIRSVFYKSSKSVHYELLNDVANEHRIICSKCGVIENVHKINADDIVKKIIKKSKKFKSVDTINFEIYSLCKGCA